MEKWEVWSTDITGFVDGVFPCLKVGGMVSQCSDVAVFPCLEVLHVYRCFNLVKVSLEALPSLKVLRVDDCGDDVLTCLVGVASPVTKLSIRRISGLSDEVWGGVVQYLGELEELRISNCEEMRNLWESEKACKVLVNLNKLFIENCVNLERLGGGEKEEEEGSNLFLTSLRIWYCNNLKHLSCPNSIEELSIKFCSSITSVSFPTIERGGGWQKLKSLEIMNCNSVLEEELKKQVLIISNTNMPIPMLQFLYINGRGNLKSIVELNCFIQLTRLVIRSCPVIESFPELQNLTLLNHLEIRYCGSRCSSSS